MISSPLINYVSAGAAAGDAIIVINTHSQPAETLHWDRAAQAQTAVYIVDGEYQDIIVQSQNSRFSKLNSTICRLSDQKQSELGYEICDDTAFDHFRNTRHYWIVLFTQGE